VLILALARLAMTVTVGVTYVWPLDVPVAPTSTFGEYRSRHFHGGLDLSTHETIGYPVHAPAEGEAVRVRASGAGYGRALYLLMVDGRTAVFGHLDGFAPPLQAWVDSVQQATGKYEQDLVPPRGRFHFARGEIVAWSGGSGAGPPHLHIELREGDTGINPWRFGLTPPDSVPPTLAALWVYPATAAGRVDGDARAHRYPLHQTAAGPTLEKPITVRGPIRAAVEAWDRTQARPNELGVYVMNASLDGNSVYEARFDSVSWLFAPEAEVVFDPVARSFGHTSAYALTPPPQLECLALHRASPSWAAPDGTHTLEITAEDVAGNRTRARVTLVWSPQAPPPAPAPRKARHVPAAGIEMDELREGLAIRSTGGAPIEVTPSLLPEPIPPSPTTGERVFGIDSIFRGSVDVTSGASQRHLLVGEITPGLSQTLRSADGQFSLSFEKGSAFDRQTVTLETWGAGAGAMYHVEPDWMPLGDAVTVRLRLPDGWLSAHTGIFRMSGHEMHFVGGADSADTRILSGSSRNLGTFTIERDTIGPRAGEARVVAPRHPPAPGTRVPPTEVRWKAADAKSGVDASGFHLVIDGRLEPAEFDPEGGILSWRPHGASARPGWHEYELTVTDHLDNATTKKGRFRLP
jgi:hypothetical protein